MAHRYASALLALLFSAALAGCDHEPRVLEDPARDRWAELGPSVRGRIAELRSRQTVVGGRIGALTLPPGVDDPQLAQIFADLQARLTTLEPAIVELERQTNEAAAEVDGALAAHDKVKARKTVEDVNARLDAAYRRALDLFAEIEPRLQPAEEALQRRVAAAQEEAARAAAAAAADAGTDAVAPAPAPAAGADTAERVPRPVAPSPR